MTDTVRLSSPAAERNRQPILDVLLRVLRHRMTTQVQRLRHTVREQAGRYPAGEALVQTLKRRRLKRWAAQRRNGDED